MTFALVPFRDRPAYLSGLQIFQNSNGGNSYDLYYGWYKIITSLSCSSIYSWYCKRVSSNIFESCELRCVSARTSSSCSVCHAFSWTCHSVCLFPIICSSSWRSVCSSESCSKICRTHARKLYISNDLHLS